MRLIDRYLLREMLVPLAYCVSGFLVLWITSELLSDLDMFQRQQLGARDIAEYYLVLLPELLVTVMPVGLLLALLYALTQLARNHELVAMRTAGLSLWRLGLPYLGAAGLFSLGILHLNETWVPVSVSRSEAILRRHEPSAQPGHEAGWRPLNFRYEPARRLWTVEAYQEATHAMRNPKVDWEAEDGTRYQLVARQAEWNGSRWRFFDAVEYEFPPAQETPRLRRQAAELEMAEFEETPEMIQSEIKITSLSNVSAVSGAQLSLRDIRNYLRLHQELSPLETAKLKTQWHGRLAEPWMCLVVALIALPLGGASGRRDVLVSVSVSIFFCFAYIILLRFGLALGTAGYCPPWLAAWYPNVLFGGLGLWLTWRAA